MWIMQDELYRATVCVFFSSVFYDLKQVLICVNGSLELINVKQKKEKKPNQKTNKRSPEISNLFEKMLFT